MIFIFPSFPFPSGSSLSAVSAVGGPIGGGNQGSQGPQPPQRPESPSSNLSTYNKPSRDGDEEKQGYIGGIRPISDYETSETILKFRAKKS